MTTNFAKAARQFVRANFAARVAKVEGEFQSTATEKGARVQITNPNTVLENLREICGKPVSEVGKTTTFKMKKVGTISLTIGEKSMLKLVNNA